MVIVSAATWHLVDGYFVSQDLGAHVLKGDDLLAGACGQTGRTAEGLSLLSQALTAAEQTGEHWHLAELHRLKGELLCGSIGDSAEAERCFRQALTVATQQRAKALELRAATSLSGR